MSLGLHESRYRRRRRFWIGVLKWCLALAFIAVMGVYSYMVGSDLAQRELTASQEKIVELKENVEQLKLANADLQAELRATAGKARDWEDRYKKDVPSGPLEELVTVMKDKLETGVDFERLRFVVNAADNPRACDKDPVTKRFIVTTPLQTGANDSVSYAANTLTVTAEGVSARNADGLPEAWFDPQEPVKLIFTHLGDDPIEVSGTLPLHHSIVLGNDEHSFSITPGARGFVTVTGERCDYP
jgi:cell division protein FtsB